MSDDEQHGGDGPPPSIAARRSQSNISDRGTRRARLARVADDRRTNAVTAVAGFAVGLLAVGPVWDWVGWPLAGLGVACVALLALSRRLALTRSAISTLRRLDLGFELLWRLTGWAIVGTGVLVIGSGQVASGAALLAAGVANMATSHRAGGLAIIAAGIALGALGISHVLADRSTGGFLLVAIGVVVVMLGTVILANAGRSARGLPMAGARSDVSRWRKR